MYFMIFRCRFAYHRDECLGKTAARLGGVTWKSWSIYRESVISVVFGERIVCVVCRLASLVQHLCLAESLKKTVSHSFLVAATASPFGAGTEFCFRISTDGHGKRGRIGLESELGLGR